MQAQLTIDLEIIKNNYNYLCSVTKSKVAAAVKANSYGLGADRICPILFEAGCRDFFVAHLEEGINLREVLSSSDANIYILNGPELESLPKFLEYDLTPSLNNLEQIKIWRESGVKKRSIIHVDTGMNRYGMHVDDFASLKTLPEGLEYIISHLACDGDKNNEYNKYQLDKFNKYTEKHNIKRSLAASGGMFLGEEYHFDMVRVGAALYGIGSDKNPNIKNPVKLTSKIIHLNYCKEESFIGYGSTSSVKKGSVLATLPIGYADGCSRCLGNRGFVYIKDVKVPILGVISMDLTVIDVTGLNCFIGDEVEIIGPNNTPDQIAPLIGTIGYEIITSLKAGRFKRLYK